MGCAASSATPTEAKQRYVEKKEQRSHKEAFADGDDSSDVETNPDHGAREGIQPFKQYRNDHRRRSHFIRNDTLMGLSHSGKYGPETSPSVLSASTNDVSEETSTTFEALTHSECEPTLDRRVSFVAAVVRPSRSPSMVFSPSDDYRGALGDGPPLDIRRELEDGEVELESGLSPATSNSARLQSPGCVYETHSLNVSDVLRGSSMDLRLSTDVIDGSRDQSVHTKHDVNLNDSEVILVPLPQEQRVKQKDQLAARILSIDL